MNRAFGALAAFTVAAALPCTAAASEAWVLNIPVRGIANQESGMVRAILELDSAPAGSQLVVNGTTTLNLGATQVVGGDSVTYEALTGNNVRITYVPLTNFGADFCAGGGANEKNIPMRFVGAQDVTAYRMSSYVVAAPLSECSQVSKHTGDTPAGLVPTDDGVAPALTATFKGRNMFDVALVLDKSGSMNDFPPGAAAGPKTFEILKSAVQGFLGLTPVAGLPQELRKRFIPIQTIAFGTPAQVDETLLRNISFETSGISYQALNVTTMFDIFGQTLVAILKGNTASMGLRRFDT